MIKTHGREPQLEDRLCQCAGCRDVVWDEDGGQTFIWFHHEKNNWQLQYQFCEPIYTGHTCMNNGQVAAVIRTDASGWTPYMNTMHCRCPDNAYYVQGWHLVDNKYWDYKYICNQGICRAEGVHTPCVR